MFAELEFEYYIYQNLNFIWELVMVKLFQVFFIINLKSTFSTHNVKVHSTLYIVAEPK